MSFSSNTVFYDDLIPITPTDAGADVLDAIVTDGAADTRGGAQSRVRGIYATVAGNISVVTLRGTTRTVPISANLMLPLRVRRINATGTTATGLFVAILGN
jgi:hypothetical protein